MKYLNILDCSIADGNGVRVVLFVSGCPHHCIGCQNPESWDPENGQLFTSETISKILKLLDRPYIKGLTISGGDPLALYNRKDVEELCINVKSHFKETKDIWLYTGYEYNEVKDLPLLKNIDVLVDGKYVKSLRNITLPFRGSSNQNIIKLK